MPTETVTERELLKWCSDPRCKGNAQTATAGLQIETAWTFEELADGPVTVHGPEHSSIRFQFANPEADAKCRVCGKDNQLGDQPRPRYEPLSGFSPDGLLHVERWTPGGRTAEVDAKLAELAEKLGG